MNYIPELLKSLKIKVVIIKEDQGEWLKTGASSHSKINQLRLGILAIIQIDEYFSIGLSKINIIRSNLVSQSKIG